MADLSRVRVPGPLAGLASGFAAELTEKGYSPRGAEGQMRLLQHVSRWLASQGLAAGDMTADVVERFVADRRRRYRGLRSARALVPLLGFLRRVGAAPMPAQPAPTGPAEVLLARFAEYLSSRRGLAAATVASYTSQVMSFLRWRVDQHGGDCGSLTAAQVREFICVRAERLRPRSVQVGVNALRALLRWMSAEGLVAVGLADSVGPVATARLAGLPQALTDAEMRDMLAALPASGKARLRNEAILALLWRLGLRAGEVAALRLDDIDWRAGVILVRGKGGQHDRMPLPVDVGELLAAYLTHGRPAGNPYRQVFLALDAPHRPIGPGGVSSVVARAAANAGITRAVHAHRLRHTTACRVLASGGGLIEVGQLLRQVSTSATATYAKVDIAALAVLARPWPGGDAR
jgi:site-specific recombinase XerD